jgi:hypothetical protein
LLAPVAETVAGRLANAAHIASLPTPLTQANRRKSHAATRSSKKRELTEPAPRLGRCKTCGAEITVARRVHCDACVPDFRAEQQAGFVVSGPRALAQLRQAGIDPASRRGRRETPGGDDAPPPPTSRRESRAERPRPVRSRDPSDNQGGSA